jgi:hypothetical protein
MRPQHTQDHLMSSISSDLFAFFHESVLSTHLVGNRLAGAAEVIILPLKIGTAPGWYICLTASSKWGCCLVAAAAAIGSLP